MTVAARLVTTIAAPMDPASSEAPGVLHWPDHRLLVQRGDTEVVALDVDAFPAGRVSEVRFPAPWPRHFGSVTVSPERDAAVFAGLHAVRSVEATGTTRSALWRRWDGQQLTTPRIGIERVLLAVSPSGRHLLTVDVGQWSLSLHRAEDGSLLRELDAKGTVPSHPQNTGEDRVHWDYDAAFVDQDTIVAGTSECDARYGTARHWLVDAPGMTLRGEVSYPFPVGYGWVSVLVQRNTGDRRPQLPRLEQWALAVDPPAGTEGDGGAAGDAASAAAPA
ncbi:hypothetical protein [Streptomyces sp. NPDC040750]|uniref:hypothetical protein n=1 Tax=Streptomyces sp. NPDC040750 TaxID=3154491 RepID=UPI0033DC210B